jgi:hypothetical protein
MLVSHRFRFIFTKTVKTAGTSVEAYFEQFCLPAGEDSYLPAHGRPEYESPTGIIGYRGPREGRSDKWFNHMSAKTIKQQVGDEVWNSYFKFCTIRNPWEKAISAFEHLGREYVGHDATPMPESGRFLRWLQDVGPPIDRSQYMIDGCVCVDDFIRHEHLEEDMTRICRIIGVPWEPSRMPRFKTDLRRPQATVEELYTAESARIVANIYAPEIAMFNYKMPGTIRG